MIDLVIVYSYICVVIGIFIIGRGKNIFLSSASVIAITFYSLQHIFAQHGVAPYKYQHYTLMAVLVFLSLNVIMNIAQKDYKPLGYIAFTVYCINYLFIY